MELQGQGTNLPQRLKIGAYEPPCRPTVHGRTASVSTLANSKMLVGMRMMLGMGMGCVCLVRKALGVRPKHGGTAIRHVYDVRVLTPLTRWITWPFMII